MLDQAVSDDASDLLLRAVYIALLAGAEAWARLNLTMPQLKVLLLLGLHGSAPVSWLAGRMSVSPPNVTGILDRLEQQGCVRRANDASDRRVVRVTLTPEGERVLRDLHTAGAAHIGRALERLMPEERDALRSGLAALLRVCAELAMEGAGKPGRPVNGIAEA